MNPWLCAGINQFAWPGLGSILAGRGVGFVQAALMLLGFVLFLGFMLVYFKNMMAWAANPQGTEEQLKAGYQPFWWMLIVGLCLCVLSWLWALITSLSVVRSSKTPPPPTLDTPPQIH